MKQLKFPGSGLIKSASPKAPEISKAQKVALIRKGNELFNTGNIEQAKKIFLTTRYTDGLIRIGDYYQKQNRYLQALQMYVIAPENHRKERLVEKMAVVVRNWLYEK